MIVSVSSPPEPIRFSAKRKNGSMNGSKCALPISAVRYPERRKSLAMLGASEHSGTPFIHTPCVLTCWPVSIVLRDGMHTTFCGCARS